MHFNTLFFYCNIKISQSIGSTQELAGDMYSRLKRTRSDHYPIVTFKSRRGTYGWRYVIIIFYYS